MWKTLSLAVTIKLKVTRRIIILLMVFLLGIGIAPFLIIEYLVMTPLGYRGETWIFLSIQASILILTFIIIVGLTGMGIYIVSLMKAEE